MKNCIETTTKSSGINPKQKVVGNLTGGKNDIKENTMAVYCITYELKSNNQNILENAIKAYGVWFKQSASSWLIETSYTVKEVFDYLRNYLKSGDKLMVVRAMKDWWGVGYSDDVYSWIRQRTF